jgi:4-amino-4-deoxy-L-arabinose transferase-like glycosyltransferase
MTPAATVAGRRARLRGAVRSLPAGTAALALALLVGAALRLVWIGDMEYKVDEAYLFHKTQVVGVTEGWPWLGQPSGVGLRNPGLSVWVFVVLARMFGADNPTGLARAVEVLNLAALALLVGFGLRAVSRREPEPWLWSAALVALSPVAVLFSRKIWAQSVLPFFTMLVLIAWWRRRTAWGAFAWGLLGACLGQIHMSGFFFAAGLLLWTAGLDRRSVRWGPWLAGSVAGALTLLPWLHYVAGHSVQGHRSLANVVDLHFWRLWVAHPLGLDLSPSLGHHFGSFLASPRVGGFATHGVALAYAAILACAVVIAVGAARAAWAQRRRWRPALTGREPPTVFVLNAALWGFGGLLTLSGVIIYRHYLLVVFALPFLSVAWLALVRPQTGRRALAVLCVAEALISAQFLAFIHAYHGACGADYGVSYSAQARHPDRGACGPGRRGAARLHAFDRGRQEAR